MGRLAPIGNPSIRPIVWIGDSKQDISELPGPVKASFGHRLQEVQDGKMPLDTKPLPAIGPGFWNYENALTATRSAPSMSLV